MAPVATLTELEPAQEDPLVDPDMVAHLVDPTEAHPVDPTVAHPVVDMADLLDPLVEVTVAQLLAALLVETQEPDQPTMAHKTVLEAWTVALLPDQLAMATTPLSVTADMVLVLSGATVVPLT